MKQYVVFIVTDDEDFNTKTYFYETDTAENPMQAVIQAQDAWKDDQTEEPVFNRAWYTVVEGHTVTTVTEHGEGK